MEAIALDTLKSMLISRKVDAEEFVKVQGPPDTTAYTFGGILILFSTKSRLSAGDPQKFMEFAEENSHRNGIIVISQNRLSETVEAALNAIVADSSNQLIQVFEFRHLYFDITKHARVPQHRILSSEERDAVLKEFNIQSASQMPKIDWKDAMARWIGARPGDVIEISGMCEASVQNRRYRFCIPDVING
jgi:DNA-directed RNA polymerase subunit H (RpoH/RPB5)